ncbi:MAG TPA: replicative DNA helicase [Ruminiclostridium sp.]|jgi:replicative DNA helicase|nr:replicative DNA helicase [Clostridiaceae bacterium]HAA25288.1 replicative DNA helicase [Ruminiclostridium sp.]
MDLGVLEKVPPHSIEAEQSVLGSLILDRDLLPDITAVLKSEDFYLEQHKEIFEAILDLYEQNKPVDLITVSEQLTKRGTLNRVGDYEYLSNLATAVPTTANAMHYAEIIEDKSLLRKLIHATTQIQKRSYEATEEAVDILNDAEKYIYDIVQNRNQTGLLPISDVLDITFSHLEELYNRAGEYTGVPSGFYDLDKKTAGFQKSDLVLIAARPSMGKTSFALNIAAYAAVHKQIPVAIFSLEMSKEQLVSRIISSEVLIEMEKMRKGNLEDEDWKDLANAVGVLSKAPIYIDDNAAISVMEIMSKCRRLKMRRGLGLIIIDYLQLMQSRRRTENRQQEISEISRSLKIMAKELEVPVIALSQLSRAPDIRTANHRPILSDLRESGAIEQDADLVIFLYRDDYYHEDSEKKNITEVIIAKHRNGSIGTIELAWIPQYTKFRNLERSY